jgi:hypothetical protein
MAKQLYVRMGSAAGALALAAMFVGLAPFLGGAPTAGAGVSPTIPTMSVNRALKGDRLPVSNSTDFIAPDWRYEFGQFGVRPSIGPRAQIPFGCERAFSPVATPMLANYYRRCMA